MKCPSCDIGKLIDQEDYLTCNHWDCKYKIDKEYYNQLNKEETKND